jgi:hypothetical protein
MTMRTTISHSVTRSLVLAAAGALCAGCADREPLAPDLSAAAPVHHAVAEITSGDLAIVTLRRVTARYHDLRTAIADGFVFLHGCETRPGEGPVGIVYISFEHLLDGVIDPGKPDGLIYEPRRDGPPKLVAAEMAVPYPLWTSQVPPEFLGATFQREDEFGVFGLHIWIWGDNPEGMFAESNPKVSCEVE